MEEPELRASQCGPGTPAVSQGEHSGGQHSVFKHVSMGQHQSKAQESVVVTTVPALMQLTDVKQNN